MFLPIVVLEPLDARLCCFSSFPPSCSEPFLFSCLLKLFRMQAGPDMEAPGTHANPNHGSPPRENGASSAAADPTATPENKQSSQSSSRPSTAAARHAKRLTLNFPINPPSGGLRSDQNSPAIGLGLSALPTDTPVSSMSPGRFVVNSPVPFDDSADGSDLLTAIASQERKVLELREELQRAESELARLKKQWAANEKQRKRNQINYHAEVLKTLRTAEVAEDGSKPASDAGSQTSEQSSVQARISRELERRNSVRNMPEGEVSISANGRRVFASSKHARTLSLLSDKAKAGGKGDSEQRIAGHPRSATLPSVERGTPETRQGELRRTSSGMAQWRRSMPPPSREALLQTGRQMASDFKEGFWTFLEDIRQATVGDEGIYGTEARGLQPPSSKSQQRSSSRSSRSERSTTPSERRELPGISADRVKSTATSSSSKDKEGSSKTSGNKTTPRKNQETSFWSEFGIDTPGQTSQSAKAPAHTTQDGQKGREDSNLLDVDDDDDWDAWDIPQATTSTTTKTHTPSSSRSTIESKRDQSPSTQDSSPRTIAR